MKELNKLTKEYISLLNKIFIDKKTELVYEENTDCIELTPHICGIVYIKDQPNKKYLYRFEIDINKIEDNFIAMAVNAAYYVIRDRFREHMSDRS